LQYQGTPLLVRGDRLHRNKSAPKAEEAQLHPNVLRLAAPVQIEPLGAANPLSPGISDRVPYVSLRSPIQSALFPGVYSRVRCPHGRTPFLVSIAAL
jgi:hypothetical protein